MTTYDNSFAIIFGSRRTQLRCVPLNGSAVSPIATLRAAHVVYGAAGQGSALDSEAPPLGIAQFFAQILRRWSVRRLPPLGNPT